MSLYVGISIVTVAQPFSWQHFLTETAWTQPFAIGDATCPIQNQPECGFCLCDDIVMTEARGICLLQGLVDGPARLLGCQRHWRCACFADGLQLAWLQGPQSLAFTDHASRTDTAENDITPSRTHQFKFAGSNWSTWFGPHSNQNDFVKVRVVGHLVGTVSIYRAIDGPSQM